MTPLSASKVNDISIRCFSILFYVILIQFTSSLQMLKYFPQIKLKTIIDGTIYSMKQFNLLVKCCRKPDEPQSVSFVPCEHLSQAANSHFGDEIMVQLFNAIEVCYGIQRHVPDVKLAKAEGSGLV